MRCISRKDANNNLFKQGNEEIRRRNLYSQIAIENDTLICANETYPLIDLCNDYTVSQPCTLQVTNEVVYIGRQSYE